MNREEHPATRPTRYHWAAGAHPAHITGALAGWAATIGAGLASLDPTVTGILATLSLAWSGYWLLAVPNISRFRRLTDARLLAVYENDFAYQEVELGERIHPDLRDKVQDIARLRNRAREILTGKFGEHDVFARDNLEKLDILAISYLQLLVALSEYDEYLSLVDPGNIENELAQARARVAEVKDPTIKDARQRQVDLLANRLERYHRAETRLELLQAQSRNVETTMKLLIDQAMTAADAQRVGRNIDEVLSNIRSSEILNEELAVYDDLEREIDDHRFRELE